MSWTLYCVFGRSAGPPEQKPDGNALLLRCQLVRGVRARRDYAGPCNEGCIRIHKPPWRGWDSEKSGTTALDPGRVKTLFSRSQDPKQMTGTLVLPAGQRLISPIRERSQRSWSDA